MLTTLTSFRLIVQRRSFAFSTFVGATASADRHFGANVLSLKHNAALQKKKNVMVIEGSRGIETCIKAGLSIKTRRSVVLKRISNAKLAEYSKLDTPPGIIGLFPMPENDSFVPFHREPVYPIYVILDNIRNPDNMGAILRTAAAAGCQAVFSTSGCVSLWNDKVIRASMLANLYVKVAMSLTWAEIENSLPNDCGIIIAHSKADGCNPVSSYNNRNYAELHKNGVAVILCNEANGPSDGALDFCGKTNASFIHIPMSKPIESLNVSVATGVILFRIIADFERFDNKK